MYMFLLLFFQLCLVVWAWVEWEPPNPETLTPRWRSYFALASLITVSLAFLGWLGLFFGGPYSTSRAQALRVLQWMIVCQGVLGLLALVMAIFGKGRVRLLLVACSMGILYTAFMAMGLD